MKKYYADNKDNAKKNHAENRESSLEAMKKNDAENRERAGWRK